MSESTDDAKLDLLDEAAEIIGPVPGVGDFQVYVRAYYRHVAGDDIARPARPGGAILVRAQTFRPASGHVRDPDLRVGPAWAFVVLDGVGDAGTVRRKLDVADGLQPVEVAALERRPGRRGHR